MITFALAQFPVMQRLLLAPDFWQKRQRGDEQGDRRRRTAIVFLLGVVDVQVFVSFLCTGQLGLESHERIHDEK